MALANGCLLLLPEFKNPRLRRLAWFLQCALFPFTLYFFVVFLPFLPLSIPAMLGLGCGFLILTPTVLFLVHGQRLLDGFQAEVRDQPRLAPSILCVLALSILPTIYTTQSIIDRVVLRSAIDYVYNPDYRKADHFSGSRFAVRHSLESLRDFKAGLNLPFLSEFYNWVVFDNLVLPDEKMNVIHRAFFGRDLEAAKQSTGPFNNPRTRTARREVRGNAVPPPREVALEPLTATSVRDGDCMRTTLVLNMRNSSPLQSEFVTQIKIPDGVFVSGFWLNIGKERVPGKLFEKKTALWVYEKIRDQSRRDPGILTYTDPNSLELRVFPFAANEARRVELQLLYPATLKPEVTIGQQKWHDEAATPALCLALTDDGTSALSVPPEVAAQLPRANRTPYLHFIVDRSADSNLAGEQIVQAVRAAAAQFGDASQCAVTFANYENADLPGGLQPIESLNAAAVDQALLPRQGGFLVNHAIKRVLLAAQDRLSEADETSPWLKNYPIIVVLSGAENELSMDHDLVHFAKLVPDTRKFYVTKNGQRFSAYTFQGKREDNGIEPAQPVALLKIGKAVSACPLASNQPQTLQFGTAASDRSISVLDQSGFRPLNAASTIDPKAPYSSGIRAFQHYLAWVHNPSLGNGGLTEIVDLSRESGILLAATSYIVVESSAQWKILALKERQKLNNQAALEFEEVPEPSTWVLIVVLGAGLIVAAKRRKSVTRHELPNAGAPPG